jgi:hypothetical protein
VLKPHKTLEEAIAARYVIRMLNRQVSNKYWDWCSGHARPYVTITVNAPKSRYALVELDVYCLGAGGFDKDAGYEILHTVLSQPLKPKSSFFVSPVYMFACVSEKSAKLFALYLYRRAVEELALDLVTHEEWIKGEREQSRIGGCNKSSFAPISGDAYPEVIKALLKEKDAVFK